MSTSKQRGARGSRKINVPEPPRDPYGEFKHRLFRRAKIPAWVLIGYGLVIDLLALNEVVRIMALQLQQVGQWAAVAMLILGSPYLGTVLVMAGILYLIFVGEPKSPLRSRAWPYIAYSTVLLLIASTLIAGSAIYVISQISPIRVLTERQKNIISKEAKSLAPLMYKDKAAICLTVFSIDTPEANQYASYIMGALLSGGVCSQTMVAGQSVPLQSHAIRTTARGLYIDVADPENPPAGAAILKRILSDAGIKSQYDKVVTGYPADAYALNVMPPP
jgi:hypothetical protein